MYTNATNNALSEEQIVTFLKAAVARVEGSSESDIQAFNVIKGIFKKNVSMFRRNDVAAYLIREAMNAPAGRGGRFSNKDYERKGERGDRSDRGERQERYSRDRQSRYERPSSHPENRGNAENAAAERSERPERAPRVQIDPSVSSTIFVSIGRNRRVFPRDLVGLLVSVAGLGRERIGDIRVLANYSFVQLFSEDCEKVITALNGYDYRGRKLNVSYSKQGGEEESIPASVSNESYGVSVVSEESKIADAQSEFAAQQQAEPADSAPVEAAPKEVPVSELQPYSETTDDGQVKSHFGNGAAY